MPRPRKCRKVCRLPKCSAFVPAQGGGDPGDAIVLTVDEYEALRLIDKEGFSQEQCGEYMNVARTTVQLIYASARKKTAEALVNGKALRIEGGDYRLCDGRGMAGGCRGCMRRRLMRQARGKPPRGQTGEEP